jgi:hypothetical protein
MLEFLHLPLVVRVFDGKARVNRQRPIPLGPPRTRLESQASSRALRSVPASTRPSHHPCGAGRSSDPETTI